MFGQSHIDDNIEYYRPERVLRSYAKVKLKSKVTRITKIQRHIIEALACGITYLNLCNVKKKN